MKTSRRKFARKKVPEQIVIERASHTANRIAWSPRLARQLGKVPDHVLAAKSGFSRGAVSRERRRRGVPSYQGTRLPVEWTKEMISLLGTASDRAVAATLGISPSSVANKRRALEIPSYGEPPGGFREDPFWTARRIAILGTAPDTKVGRQLGIPAKSVAYQRYKRKIVPFNRYARVVWTKEIVDLFGRVPDRVIAERFGLRADTVQSERIRRGIPGTKPPTLKVLAKSLRPLLRLPMTEIMRRTGLHSNVITRLRRELGIKPPRRASPWTPAAERACGRLSDEQVAKRFGIKLSAVTRRRHRMRIRIQPARPRWTKEEDHWVRTLPVDKVVAKTGRTRKAVLDRRSRIGVSSPRFYVTWTPAALRSLGRVPDVVLARKLGTTKKMVQAKRLAMGILYTNPWTKREDLLVQRLPIKEAARRTGRTVASVSNRRKRLRHLERMWPIVRRS